VSQTHSLLGLTVSRIYPYTIPCAYGGINSVPSILIVSTVRLDIQIERSQSYQYSQTTVKQTLFAEAPTGWDCFPLDKNKKRKGGCWLPFGLPLSNRGWPRLSVVEQSMNLRVTDGFHASCKCGSVQLISPRPCECLIRARPSKHIELNTLVSSIPHSP